MFRPGVVPGQPAEQYNRQFKTMSGKTLKPGKDFDARPNISGRHSLNVDDIVERKRPLQPRESTSLMCNDIKGAAPKPMIRNRDGFIDPYSAIGSQDQPMYGVSHNNYGTSSQSTLGNAPQAQKQVGNEFDKNVSRFYGDSGNPTPQRRDSNSLRASELRRAGSRDAEFKANANRFFGGGDATPHTNELEFNRNAAKFYGNEPAPVAQVTRAGPITGMSQSPSVPVMATQPNSTQYNKNTQNFYGVTPKQPSSPAGPGGDMAYSKNANKFYGVTPPASVTSSAKAKFFGVDDNQPSRSPQPTMNNRLQANQQSPGGYQPPPSNSSSVRRAAAAFYGDSRMASRSSNSLPMGAPYGAQKSPGRMFDAQQSSNMAQKPPASSSSSLQRAQAAFYGDSRGAPRQAPEGMYGSQQPPASTTSSVRRAAEKFFG